MSYLLKTTIAWVIFLVLFETLYKRNGNFLANRVFLLSSLALGLLLPVIPLPVNIPAVVSVTQNLYPSTAQLPAPAVFTTIATATAAPASQSKAAGIDIWLILRFAYIAGVLVLLLKCAFEVMKISLLIIRNPRETICGHRVITTGRQHAPYSFAGLIFIANPTFYSTQELEYIVRHEAAHNNGRHWLDLWLMQLCCIVFWPHPLVWRYRHQLLLQHEYEADAIAANEDPYPYGHFLLQQTLLRGAPSIAHSFHFSPIKNRIDMLTRKHNFKKSYRMYLLLVPALLACTFFMTRAEDNTEPAQHPNETNFKGNTFTWQHTVAEKQDNTQKQAGSLPDYFAAGKSTIVRMNNEPVYQNSDLKTPARYEKTDRVFLEYVGSKFAEMRKKTQDSTAYVVISDVVINKEGKVVYYHALYARPMPDFLRHIKFWEPYPRLEPVLNSFVDKIMSDAPNWKPAMVDGKPVNSFVTFGGC